MEEKQSDEVTISLSNAGKKRKRIYFFPCIFSTAELKIIGSFIIQKLMSALQCSFSNNGALANCTR